MTPDRHDLCGWELNNPDRDTFDVEVMDVFGGCKNCELVNECTTPCESVRRLVPREGRLLKLGHSREEDGPKMSYFALLSRDEVKYILLSAPDHYWARASFIAQEFVPAWALSQLTERKNK